MVRKKFGFCESCMFLDLVNDWETQPTCLYCDNGSAYKMKINWVNYAKAINEMKMKNRGDEN